MTDNAGEWRFTETAVVEQNSETVGDGWHLSVN